MATNGFLQFAPQSTSANCLTDPQYAANNGRANGFGVGLADEKIANKAWLQSSTATAALMQFAADWSAQDCLDSTPLAQLEGNLRMAIAASQSGAYYGIDTSGTANVVTIVLAPVPTAAAFTNFQYLWIKVANTNTGPVTVQQNGFGPRSWLRRDGSPLQAGDLVAGTTYQVINDGVSFRLQAYAQSELIALVKANAPVFATANVTLYVATNGSDTTGDGTQTKPFATPAFAASFGASRFIFAGYQLIIQMADGTYPAPGVLPQIGGSLVLQGNITTQANVMLSGNGPSVSGVGLVAASQGNVTLRGVTVQNNGQINHNVAAFSAGSLTIQFVTLLTSTQIPYGLVFAGPGGNVTVLDGCTMGGGAAWMWYVLGPGNITMGAVVNVSGVAFSIATAAVSGPGFITYSVPTVYFAVSGTVTGQRYSVTLNGAIRVGGSATFFPGSSNGSTDGTGAYG